MICCRRNDVPIYQFLAIGKPQLAFHTGPAEFGAYWAAAVQPSITIFGVGSSKTTQVNGETRESGTESPDISLYTRKAPKNEEGTRLVLVCG